MERKTLMNKSKTTAALGVGLLTLLGLNISAAAPDDEKGAVKTELEGITFHLKKPKAEQGDAKVELEGIIWQGKKPKAVRGDVKVELGGITWQVKKPKAEQEGPAGTDAHQHKEHVGHEIRVIEQDIRVSEKDHREIK
jgi:hypothetical protein